MLSYDKIGSNLNFERAFVLEHVVPSAVTHDIRETLPQIIRGLVHGFDFPSPSNFPAFSLLPWYVSVSLQTVQLVEAIAPKAHFSMTCGHYNSSCVSGGSRKPQRVQSRPLVAVQGTMAQETSGSFILKY